MNNPKRPREETKGPYLRKRPNKKRRVDYEAADALTGLSQNPTDEEAPVLPEQELNTMLTDIATPDVPLEGALDDGMGTVEGDESTIQIPVPPEEDQTPPPSYDPGVETVEEPIIPGAKKDDKGFLRTNQGRFARKKADAHSIENARMKRCTTALRAVKKAMQKWENESQMPSVFLSYPHQTLNKRDGLMIVKATTNELASTMENLDNEALICSKVAEFVNTSMHITGPMDRFPAKIRRELINKPPPNPSDPELPSGVFPPPGSDLPDQVMSSAFCSLTVVKNIKEAQSKVKSLVKGECPGAKFTNKAAQPPWWPENVPQFGSKAACPSRLTQRQCITVIESHNRYITAEGGDPADPTLTYNNGLSVPGLMATAVEAPPPPQHAGDDPPPPPMPMESEPQPPSPSQDN